jgi:hypothetical protein
LNGYRVAKNYSAHGLKNGFVETSTKIFGSNESSFARRIPDEWPKNPGYLAAEKEIRYEPDKKHPSGSGLTAGPALQDWQQSKIANNSGGRDEPGEEQLQKPVFRRREAGRSIKWRRIPNQEQCDRAEGDENE